MKRLTYFNAFAIATLIIITAISCDSKRQPGKVYMPDMAYSRAYETYALRDSTIFTMDAADANHKIFYNNRPVSGTIKRGELAPYTVPNDSNGLLNLSNLVKNPLGPLTKVDSLEASRLFNINCGVCHGAKAEANGPVAAKIGGVKSIMSALTGNATTPGFSDGRVFYVMTYGQNNMGSYASQLSKEQRWRIIQYLRTLQPKTVAVTTLTTVTKVDSVRVKK